MRGDTVPEGRRWPLVLLSAFVAVTEVVGYGFSRATQQNGWQPQWPAPPVCVAALVGIDMVVYLVLLWWFGAWDRADVRPAPSHARAGGEEPHRWSDRRFFLASAALILICWLPYLVVYAPGSLPWDGVRSMNQFITDAPLENHHPVAMNALYAGLMTLGRALGSDNRGVALIVGFQTVICVVAFADSLSFVRHVGAARWMVSLGLAFFCLHPMWGLFAQAAIKDTLFNGLFVLFCTFLARVMAEGSRRQWAGLIASSAAVCFARNNGIYIVVAALAGLLLWLLRRHRYAAGRLSRVVAALAAAPVAYLLAFNLLWPALGINTHEDKEMLSVPLQQTARYLNRHGDDVTPEEHDAIAAILPYDDLAGLYEPDLSDGIKEKLVTDNGSLAPEQRSAYLEAWWHMFLRHPSTYVAATVANTYAYFYPWKIVGPELYRPFFYTIQEGLPINKSFVVSYVFPQGLRDTVTAAVATGPLEVPVLCALYSPATFVLLYLCLLCYALHRRNRLAYVVALPAVMLLLTTLAGPLNGQLRYVMPIAAELPLLACMVRLRMRDETAQPSHSLE